jgi:hypothetical protein
VSLVGTNISEKLSDSFIMVTRIEKNPDEGGAKFLGKVGFYRTGAIQ